jgi:hypothetical protein
MGKHHPSASHAYAEPDRHAIANSRGLAELVAIAG